MARRKQMHGKRRHPSHRKDNSSPFNKNFDLKGYFKGEQGLVPDFKGQGTKQMLEENKEQLLDQTQNVLGKIGTVPMPGSGAFDVLNAGVSVYRGATEDDPNKKKTFYKEAALNASYTIPGVKSVTRGLKTGKNIIEKANRYDGAENIVENLKANRKTVEDTKDPFTT
tara:strand:- start:150 stop:653 length:504 start_codon:yes stop_codon:yes gene_type:complete